MLPLGLLQMTFALAVLVPVNAAVTGEHPRLENLSAETSTTDSEEKIESLSSVASTSDSEETIDYWRTLSKTVLLDKMDTPLMNGTAKNVILFLGDGMSVVTLAAARIYLGQLDNESGESSQLSFEKFPYSGFSKTYCVNAQVADSACSSVAYLGGVKANKGTLGVTAAVSRENCSASLDSNNHVDTILSWAQAAGKATGIVTTTTVTHASPGGNYAHSAERDWESDADMESSSAEGCEDIAKQLVYNTPGRNCKVVMGGGRSKFLPTNSSGERLDDVDLTSVWLEDKTSNGISAQYVTDRDQLLAVDVNTTDYLLGLFQDSHMLYHLEDGSDEQPTLAEMTEVAIKILSKESSGFYLFVEGGRIDMAHHHNMARRSLDETHQFQKAVQTAVDLVDEEDTLIVVTADHAHTVMFAGYPSRGNDILGLGGTGNDQLKYTTLSYANGPSAEVNRTGYRHDVTSDNMTASDYAYPSLVPLDSETHGGEDVAVFAKGPWAHLFSGNYEQSQIPLTMAYAANIGPMALRNETWSSTSISPTTSDMTSSPMSPTASDLASSSFFTSDIVTAKITQLTTTTMATETTEAEETSSSIFLHDGAKFNVLLSVIFLYCLTR